MDSKTRTYLTGKSNVATEGNPTAKQFQEDQTGNELVQFFNRSSRCPNDI